MTETDTSTAPDPDAGWSYAVRSGRHTAVIRNEPTTEIPVHLLFRDDDEPAPGPARPPVLGSGGGVFRTAGAREPVVGRGATTRAEGVLVGGAAAPAREAGAGAPSAPSAPPGDPALTERPGRALPGSAAVLAATAGAAGCGAAQWWAGGWPEGVLRALHLPAAPAAGYGPGQWAALAASGAVTAAALAGLRRGRAGRAWVLSRFGRYRGSVRRTGLLWLSPLDARRRVDVRLRHWRGELPVADADGLPLRVTVLVVWRVADTARAALSVADHETYLTSQVESALASVLSRLPADVFPAGGPSLRDADAVATALTGRLAAEVSAAGVEVFSARPTRVEYAPEVASAVDRRKVAALDRTRREAELASVVDAVEDTVNALAARGLVEFDEYERKGLVRDLTVEFWRGARP
ncbi:SPFH domain-containing protein [Streptomyces sp. NPDC060194]|uniref:SPFH domain-containing protein n=1 Tax=Streptomyces sp. NPDC060194 TaxID=3347069 RepID=UPI00364AC0AE